MTTLCGKRLAAPNVLINCCQIVQPSRLDRSACLRARPPRSHAFVDAVVRRHRPQSGELPLDLPKGNPTAVLWPPFSVPFCKRSPQQSLREAGGRSTNPDRGISFPLVLSNGLSTCASPR